MTNRRCLLIEAGLNTLTLLMHLTLLTSYCCCCYCGGIGWWYFYLNIKNNRWEEEEIEGIFGWTTPTHTHFLNHQCYKPSNIENFSENTENNSKTNGCWCLFLFFSGKNCHIWIFSTAIFWNFLEWGSWRCFLLDKLYKFVFRSWPDSNELLLHLLKSNIFFNN